MEVNIEPAIPTLIEFINEYKTCAYLSTFLEKTSQKERDNVLWYFVKTPFLRRSVQLFTSKTIKLIKLSFEDIRLKWYEHDETTKLILNSCGITEDSFYLFIKEIKEKLTISRSSTSFESEVKRYKDDFEKIQGALEIKINEQKTQKENQENDKKITDRIISNLESKLHENLKELELFKDKLNDVSIHREKLDVAMMGVNNYILENKRLKEEIKKQSLLMIKSESIKKEDIEKHNYQSFLHTVGVGELEKKLQELFDLNKKLSKENGELRIINNELMIKIKKFEVEEKKKMKIYKDQLKNLFDEFNQSEKNLADFYLYMTYKKRKNRDHREKLKIHLDNNCCKKAKKTHFFSFPVRDVLFEILKEKGFEDVVFLDEKNCCQKASILILKAIDYLCINYGGKSNLWYRHFIVKKYKNKNFENMKVNSANTSKIDERFYWTYLSEYVCNKEIKLETFMDDKHKFVKYYKQYEKLDKQIGCKIRYYHQTTEDLHKIKMDKKEKIYLESIAYLNGDKKLPVVHEKHKKWNYNIALSRITNVKYKKKIKKIIKRLIQTDRLLPQTQDEKDKNFVTKYIDSGILQQYNDKINQMNDDKKLANIISENLLKNLSTELLLKKTTTIQKHHDIDTDSDVDESDSDSSNSSS